jgi:hypothetical protein
MFVYSGVHDIAERGWTEGSFGWGERNIGRTREGGREGEGERDEGEKEERGRESEGKGREE